ncbi:imm11 family protein [Thermoactinomyces mirandus]|uniref:Immunity MXAN-0049 protein domain-containing protein n=1 Tax=Thermoactinomyces mirandus TaxID=2756294 RepID=A0A7W1XRQ0_9BACL|nr:DUF1629 domain-containing protein [Thermoactinomyces mirandus]MBA4602064.1 hypothetical protein [Thermoactinomyces mirandus]
MKIWHLECLLNSFESLGFADFDRDSKLADLLLQTSPLIDKWNNVEVLTIDEGKDSDSPHFWDCPVPVFSERAYYTVQDFLRNKAEALSLNHPEKIFYAIHVLNAIDAVDYQKAIIKQLDTGFRVGFEKYAFIEEKVEDEHIFRIFLDDRIRSAVFVSDEFKKAVESDGLAGFQFMEVWDSGK